MQKKLSKRNLWEIFERREALTNQEIDELISDSKKALKYLDSRAGFEQAAEQVRLDINCLLSYISDRREGSIYYIRDNDGNIMPLKPIK